MTPEEYFLADGFSNSEMKRIEESKRPPRKKYDTTDIFLFGSAFDAAITQIKVYRSKYLPMLDDKMKKKIEAMRTAFFNNAYCERFFGVAQFQVAIFNKLTFKYNGVCFVLLCKCLFDMLVQNPFTLKRECGTDIKTVDATNEAQFLAACEFHAWTRSRVFYMLVAGIDRDAVIGVSKHHPHNVFIKHIKRGTPEFNRCVREIVELAYYHWALKAK